MPRRSARKSVKPVRKVTKRRLSKSQSKKRVKLVVITALFILSIGVLTGIGLLNKLNQRFASADSPNSINIENQGIYSTLYLYVGDLDNDPLLIEEIRMIFIDRSNGRVVSYNIPVSIEVDVPGNFGIEPLSKVYALGSLNSEDKFEGGLTLLQHTLGSVFGYYPDKYIVVDQNLHEPMTAFFTDGSWPLKAGPIKTNYSLSEFYRTYKLINSVSDDKFVLRSFNQDTVDSELKDLTFESDISMERLSIAILNGSGIPGVASFGSRVIQNMGGRVVFSGNADKIYNESILVAEDPSSDTVKKIVQSFEIDKVLKKGEFNITENEVNRSDIVLIFGLDRGEQL